MSSRASGGAHAATLITAAIIGFAGGAYFGTQAGGGAAGADSPPDETSAATSEPDEPNTGDVDGGSADPSTSETPAAESSLTLTAAQDSVAPDAPIDLSGALDPPAEGVVLRVQRQLDGGAWELFPSADSPLEWTTNADGTFSGNINTGRTGLNGIRVIRADDESVVSNVVEVTVG